MKEPTIRQTGANAETPGRGSRPFEDPTTPETIRVLLIEDNMADARMIQLSLQNSPGLQQYEITHFDTLRAGIAFAQEQKPDIILLDLHVNDSAGWVTFEKMRDAAHQVPIVISTGLQDDNLALRAIQAGAQDYLSKDLISTPGIVSRIVRNAIQREQDKAELRVANTRLEKTLVELREAQLSLVQAEKLKTIGRLAAGVAHEVKNPLAIIRMGMDFVRQKYAGKDDTLKIIIEDLRDATDRADKIVNELMQYGAPHALHQHEANINDVIRSAVRFSQYAIKTAQVNYKENLEANIPLVIVDSEKMVQVFVNSILNATQAMWEGGGLTIHSYSCPMREFNPDADKEAVAVVVDVIDTGPGIPQDILEKLFEPFFTTKETGKGTGLGLSVSRMILDLHHGGMTLENHPQGGAIARIYLPAVDGENNPAMDRPVD